jgi:hypothetical protein
MEELYQKIYAAEYTPMFIRAQIAIQVLDPRFPEWENLQALDCAAFAICFNLG